VKSHRLISGGALFALAAFLAVPAAAWDLAQVNKRADENLVQVGDGCSGTLVNVENRLIITAYHCINDAVKSVEKPKTDMDGETIMGPDGKPVMLKEKKVDDVPIHQFWWDAKGVKSEITYNAKIVARDQKLDVAILQLPQKIGPVVINIAATESVPLAPKDYSLPRGSVVWHIGNPMMLYGTVVRGIKSADRSLADYGFESVKFYIQYDGGLTGGSSGGAIYDDNGTYIGITVMSAPSATFLSFSVPMSDVWTVAENACLASELGGTDPAKCTPAAKPAAK
jgi:S1-C subfamily serine protease